MPSPYNNLEKICENASRWPANLLRSKSFKRSLVSWNKDISYKSDRLFDPNPEYTLVEFFELSDGKQEFQLVPRRSLNELKQHFEEVNRKDPKCRMVFFESENSRAPLDCSKEMFTYVASFLQIMGPFSELLLGFGSPQAGKEFHYTLFRQENYVGTQAKGFKIPRLGRSGREIRHCYNLWSTEESDARGPKFRDWSLRQTAVYHTFDLESGQSLWVNISANDEIQSRIRDATTSCDNLKPNSMLSLPGSFSATLKTHQIIFEWCSENWRRYISDLDAKLRVILDKVNNAPIENAERSLTINHTELIKPFLPGGASSTKPPTRKNTMDTLTPNSPISPSRAWTGFSDNTMVTSPTTVQPPVRKKTTGPSTPSSPISPSRAWTGFNNHTMVLTSPTTVQSSRLPSLSSHSTTNSPQELPVQGSGSGVHDGANQDPLEVLQYFSLQRLQSLGAIAAELHTAGLVMRLNAEIMRDIVKYFETLSEVHDDFPVDIQTNCKKALFEFSSHTKSTIRGFEIEQARIATLMLLLQDGRELFDKFLQFRHTEQNTLFTANAHQSAQAMQKLTEEMHESTINMEKIAAKTEKETASMHIITLVTLVFLPGTFVATLFGSGLFQWDQNNFSTSTLGVWKGKYFLVFLAACLPLMFITLGVWVLFTYIRPRCKAYQGRKSRLDVEKGKDVEKVDEKDDRL